MNNENILVTGGTGSFGSTFLRMTLLKQRPAKIIIFSRDEMKQWELAEQYREDPRVEFVIGDVRDSDRLKWCMNNVDIVVHAAATKIVPTAELNPYECVKTNISGAVNVAESAIACNVKKVVALSTDKACNPINLYGATKLASDKIFVAANPFGSKRKTRFSVVRYGNVMGSRGSVIPFFKTLLAGGADSFPITDVRMTRFMITLEQAVELVWLAASDMVGGEIYVKKIPSMKLTDIATAISDEVALKIVGIRPGEKVHEHMISPEDATNTFEYDSYYKIFPSIGATSDFDEIVGDGVRVMEGFSYASDTNDDWMTVMQLRKWLSTRYN